MIIVGLAGLREMIIDMYNKNFNLCIMGVWLVVRDLLPQLTGDCPLPPFSSHPKTTLALKKHLNCLTLVQKSDTPQDKECVSAEARGAVSLNLFVKDPSNENCLLQMWPALLVRLFDSLRLSNTSLPKTGTFLICTGICTA